MDTIEQYEFDRQGYVVIKNLITKQEAAALLAATEALEEHAAAHIAMPPRKTGHFGGTYHRSEEKGYHTTGSCGAGESLIIEDFFNADPAFDFLVDHQKTMSYINAIVQDKIRINNSEIRLRYPGNATGTHMGGPIGHKYRYAFTSDKIDCMMVRMIYFLHDVPIDNGAFCVVPGTHKSNWNTPYTVGPDDEPGMIGLEAEAGDGILFTEHLRHGGLTNHSTTPRKTLHVGYGPAWMMSQNIATWDELQYILPQTLERYTENQKKLFTLP